MTDFKYQLTFRGDGDNIITVDAPQADDGYPADFIRSIISFCALKARDSAQITGKRQIELDCQKILRILGLKSIERQGIQ